MTRPRHLVVVSIVLILPFVIGIGIEAINDSAIKAAAMVVLFTIWGAYEIPRTYRARAAAWGSTEATLARRYQIAALVILIVTGVVLALLDLSDGVSVSILIPAIIASASIEVYGDAQWRRHLDRCRVVEAMPGIPDASITTRELEQATGLSRRRIYRATTDLYFDGVITLPVGHAGYKLVDVKE